MLADGLTLPLGAMPIEADGDKLTEGLADDRGDALGEVVGDVERDCEVRDGETDTLAEGLGDGDGLTDADGAAELLLLAAELLDDGDELADAGTKPPGASA